MHRVVNKQRGLYMLNSFYIRNFRLFREFSIENFGRVNLIAGKNNPGMAIQMTGIGKFGTNSC